MDIKRKYRQYQNTLMVAGQGTILLCAWSVIKFVMYLTVDKEYLFSKVDSSVLSQIVVVLSFLILGIDIFFRYKIGMSAVTTAKEQKKGNSYRVLIVIYLIYSLLLDIASLAVPEKDRIAEMVSALMIEIVSLSLLVMILVSSYKMKKYQKMIKTGI